MLNSLTPQRAALLIFVGVVLFISREATSVGRFGRIVIGLGLIGAAATGAIGAWGWLGLLPLATGAIGWCPPYGLLGINTCKTRSE